MCLECQIRVPRPAPGLSHALAAPSPQSAACRARGPQPTLTRALAFRVARREWPAVATPQQHARVGAAGRGRPLLLREGQLALLLGARAEAEGHSRGGARAQAVAAAPTPGAPHPSHRVGPPTERG